MATLQAHPSEWLLKEHDAFGIEFAVAHVRIGTRRYPPA